jgi:rubredoxin
MYINDYSFKCKICKKEVRPDFGEVHFDLCNGGDCFESETDDIVCQTCGATYRLIDVEITPVWKQVTNLD